MPPIATTPRMVARDGQLSWRGEIYLASHNLRSTAHVMLKVARRASLAQTPSSAPHVSSARIPSAAPRHAAFSGTACGSSRQDSPGAYETNSASATDPMAGDVDAASNAAGHAHDFTPSWLATSAEDVQDGFQATADALLAQAAAGMQTTLQAEASAAVDGSGRSASATDSTAAPEAAASAGAPNADGGDSGRDRPTSQSNSSRRDVSMAASDVGSARPVGRGGGNSAAAPSDAAGRDGADSDAASFLQLGIDRRIVVRPNFWRLLPPHHPAYLARGPLLQVSTNLDESLMGRFQERGCNVNKRLSAGVTGTSTFTHCMPSALHVRGWVPLAGQGRLPSGWSVHDLEWPA